MSNVRHYIQKFRPRINSTIVLNLKNSCQFCNERTVARLSKLNKIKEKTMPIESLATTTAEWTSDNTKGTIKNTVCPKCSQKLSTSQKIKTNHLCASLTYSIPSLRPPHLYGIYVSRPWCILPESYYADNIKIRLYDEKYFELCKGLFMFTERSHSLNISNWLWWTLHRILKFSLGVF